MGNGSDDSRGRRLRLRLAERLLNPSEQEQLSRPQQLKAQLIESEKARKEAERKLGGNETQARLFLIDALIACERGDYLRADAKLDLLDEVAESRRRGKNKTIYVPNAIELELFKMLRIGRISGPIAIYFNMDVEQKRAYTMTTVTLPEGGYRVLEIIDKIPTKILSAYAEAPTSEQRLRDPAARSMLPALLDYSIGVSAFLVEHDKQYATIPYDADSKLLGTLAATGAPLKEGAHDVIEALGYRHRQRAEAQHAPFVDRSLSNVFQEDGEPSRQTLIAHDFETLAQYTTHGHNAVDMLRKLHPLLPRDEEERNIALFCKRHGVVDSLDFRLDMLVRAIRVAGQYGAEYPQGERRVAEDYGDLVGVQLSEYSLAGIVESWNSGPEKLLSLVR